VAEIDVVAVQRKRFCRPHRGDREQTDQRLMTQRAQPRREPPGSRDQCRDLLTGVDVRGDPWPMSGSRSGDGTGPHQAVLAIGLGKPSADYLASQIRDVIDPPPLATPARIR